MTDAQLRKDYILLATSPRTMKNIDKSLWRFAFSKYPSRCLWNASLSTNALEERQEMQTVCNTTVQLASDE